jgi:hypothetical protein
MFSQPLLETLTDVLSIFEMVALLSVSREFRKLIHSESLGVLIALKIRRDVDRIHPIKTSFINVNTGRMHSSIEFKDGEFTSAGSLIDRVIDTTKNKSISSWTLDMKEWIRWLSISVLERYPIWMYQPIYSPLYPGTGAAGEIYVIARKYIESSIKNRLSDRIQPTMFKSKAKKGQYKSLTKEQNKFNKSMDIFQRIRRAVFHPVQYKKSLLNIFRLLNDTQSLQSGSDVHLKIVISPPRLNPDIPITFSSGKSMPIPRLQIQLAKAENRTVKHIRRCTEEEDDLFFNFYKEETVVRIVDGDEIVCVIYSDGHVINTSLFSEYESFLEEFNRDIWENSGIIGRICNACIFCQKPLTNKDSLEKGFGSVCEKKWGLHLYRARENQVVVNNRNSTAVNGAFSQQQVDMLSLFKPMDQEPPRKKIRTV